MCWWKTALATLCQTFTIFKKLGVEADELEGLLAQAVCHAPQNLGQVAFNQLVTAVILEKGNKKPLSTFVGQVIINALQKSSKSTQRSSPFIYWVSEPLDSAALHSCLQSPHFSRPLTLTNDVRHPLNILLINLGGHAFTAAVQDTGKLTSHTPRGLQTQVCGPHCLGHLVRYAKGHLSIKLSLPAGTCVASQVC
ncbi:hypothetical protein O181_036493 [Austropuccinia psidii MF-1]|uniref:Uncharacterized protein n=1 Tax=Austropuccinia psidii MF-1 TaxID=1389203 RepID=A0A9Q3H991_9BASI|nr:hypothetical protein [Austropuccinia psidii MF-1]